MNEQEDYSIGFDERTGLCDSILEYDGSVQLNQIHADIGKLHFSIGQHRFNRINNSWSNCPWWRIPYYIEGTTFHSMCVRVRVCVCGYGCTFGNSKVEMIALFLYIDEWLIVHLECIRNCACMH